MSITLQNSEATPSLYLPINTAGAWFAYLLPPKVTAGSSFALDDTWTTGTPAGAGPPGYYLFCPQAPQNLATFVQNAWAYFQQNGYSGKSGLYPYFVWIHEPDTAGLDADIMTVASSYPNPKITSGGANVNIGNNYTLFLNTGASVIANLDATPASFTLQGQRNLFTANQYQFQTQDVSGTVTLVMDGNARGCLQLGITVSSAQEYAALDVGLRYYISTPAPPSPNLQSLQYPVFSWTAPISFNASLNPLNPTDSTTSYLSFPTGTALTSYFSTALAQTVTMTTLSTSVLSFQPYPNSTTPPANTPPELTMVPCGQFAMSVPAPPNGNGTPLIAGQSIMCGVAGTEYIGPVVAQKSIITFLPGQPAYAPGYSQGQSGSPPPSGTPLLSSSATTSWVSIAPPADSKINYYTQPNKAELYSSPSSNFLNFLEVIAEVFTKASPSFPMAPYAAVAPAGGLTLSDYQNLELQVLSPYRRQLVTPPPAFEGEVDLSRPRVLVDADPVTGATPQGLLATLEGPSWTRLVLAQDVLGTWLEFYQNGTPLPTALTGALQTNQQFLVISDPTLIAKFLMTTSANPPNSLNISGWNFVLDPAQWKTFGTILVFKFRHGTLQQFAADTTVWTQATTFNTNPATTSDTLSQIINDAVSNTDPDFQFFATQIATNPDWNGILFLNAVVPLASLPPEIEGLAGGIDASKFYAHHLGIQVTPLKINGGQPQQQQSSLFGLIYYENDAYPPADASGYNFNVLNLKVLFENSSIKSFASQIEVSLDKLFGEPVLQENSASNSIVLDGSYQNENGKQSYAFGESGDNIFQFTNSGVLNNVEILKAQFTTSIPSAGLKPGDPVQTRFSFWGNLNFKALKGFDVLSFGADPSGSGTNPYFLRFGNLCVDMDFTFTGGAVTGRTFTFDPNQMSFDIGSSQARPPSLYNHFPLKFTGLISATDTQMPSDLGFMQIDTPLASASLNYPWYGLTFDLNLGSVGALAGQVGLVASIILAWCPSPNNYNVLVGLKLPGSSGSSKEISIEGVIKITFQDLEFIVSGDTYILKLQNIALKFLSVSIPPNGQTDILLFGDPKQVDNTTLGWYAAYAQKPTPPPSNGGTKQLAAGV
ncbi:MAG TPA: hypothetical protein VJ183_10415 [Chloroflexia bacterium]|nr:hypothetical protein [Chloroflexia bacterium]